MGGVVDPFVGTVPEEIPLERPPLERVIAQVRFGAILEVAEPEFIAPFQGRLRKAYPKLRQEGVFRISIGGDARGEGEQPKRQTIWRFLDVDEGWRVSLAQDFLALETEAYVSRSDLIERMRFLLEALTEEIEPSLLERVGVRYIDRIKGPEFGEITKLVEHRMLGVVGEPSFEAHGVHALSDAIFGLPEEGGSVRARWGILPGRASIDPNAIAPCDEDSWILDLDAYAQYDQAFDPGEILQKLEAFARRSYSIFRWAVTDEFLRTYGGIL